MDELIDRFFKKDCSREEAEQVIAYLGSHPHELDKHLSRDEWEQSAPVQMDNEFWDGVWMEIQSKKKRASHVVWFKRAAVAASIAIIATLIYTSFIGTKKESVLPVAATEQVSKPEQKITVNNTNAAMKIVLPDSSRVTLAPGSVIVYDVPFNNVRDVSLEGKARFAVQHDPSRPFTVYAAGISTTALGTEFTIITHERQSNNTTVKLHTGKVVIKNIKAATGVFTEPVYLVAGQQFNFNEKNALNTVGIIQNEGDAKLSVKAKPRISKLPAKDELSFVNSPLSEVMNKLSDYFNTKITFNSTDLDAMNFTGNVSKQDSLGIVLKVIAQMNGLEVTDQDGNFSVHKKD